MNLEEAYRNTHYTSVLGITLLIGSESPELDAILSSSDLESAIFITAWNPFSELKSDCENRKLNDELRTDLLKLLPENRVISGFGEDPSGEWPGEDSFLALGISLEEGIRLARKYQQNAFVYHHVGAKTELVFPSKTQQ